MSEKGLIADIGGTNARFALCDADGVVSDVLVLQCADYPTVRDAAMAYLEKTHTAANDVRHAAIDIACPVLGDEVAMTNCPWRFSKSALQRDMHWETFDLVNDFIAQALAVPQLTDAEKIKIGRGKSRAGFPVVVLGPGTGLGASILVPNGDEWIAVAGEGGHSTIPALTDDDDALLSALRRLFVHVSAERVISGQGLLNLYRAVCVLHNTDALLVDPAEVSEKAVSGDALCLEALNAMFRFLGILAGNMALTAGALGGVYLAGGILPRKGVFELFEKSCFRAAFEEKGRFSSYLAEVPTYVMTAENPAFSGLSGLIVKKINGARKKCLQKE